MSNIIFNTTVLEQVRIRVHLDAEAYDLSDGQLEGCLVQFNTTAHIDGNRYIIHMDDKTGPEWIYISVSDATRLDTPNFNTAFAQRQEETTKRWHENWVVGE